MDLKQAASIKLLPDFGRRISGHVLFQVSITTRETKPATSRVDVNDDSDFRVNQISPELPMATTPLHYDLLVIPALMVILSERLAGLRSRSLALLRGALTPTTFSDNVALRDARLAVYNVNCRSALREFSYIPGIQWQSTSK